MNEEKTPNFKTLLSYVSRLKKGWNIAVYDPHSKKRAVADTLPQAMEKLKREEGNTEEVIVIDQKTAAQLSHDLNEKK